MDKNFSLASWASFRMRFRFAIVVSTAVEPAIICTVSSRPFGRRFADGWLLKALGIGCVVNDAFFSSGQLYFGLKRF